MDFPPFCHDNLDCTFTGVASNLIASTCFHIILLFKLTAFYFNSAYPEIQCVAIWYLPVCVCMCLSLIHPPQYLTGSDVPASIELQRKFTFTSSLIASNTSPKRLFTVMNAERMTAWLNKRLVTFLQEISFTELESIEFIAGGGGGNARETIAQEFTGL